MMTGWGVILKTTLKKGDNSELVKSGLNIWKTELHTANEVTVTHVEITKPNVIMVWWQIIISMNKQTNNAEPQKSSLPESMLIIQAYLCKDTGSGSQCKGRQWQ